MKFRNCIIYAGLIGLWIGTSAIADWTIPTPGGPVTFDAFTTGGGTKQLPKEVWVDSVGAQVGVIGNPIYIRPSAGGNNLTIGSTGAISANAVQINGTNVSASNPLPVNQVNGGAALTAANPLPGQLSQSNAAVSNSNTIFVAPIANNATVSNSNPLTVTPQIEPATFNASTFYGMATGSTDFMCIAGSATKTIKIKKIEISNSRDSSSGSIMWVQIWRRSGGASSGGGGSFSITPVKSDQNDSPNATATITGFNINPTTITTGVGRIRSLYMNSPGYGPIPILFHKLNEKPITLRGTTEALCMNSDATSGAGMVILWGIEWTEE